MKKTKKIELEIYSEKMSDFYLALFKSKLKGDFDTELMNTIVSAIHFDTEAFLKRFSLDDYESGIQEKLLNVHATLLSWRKDSEDYFLVSKNDLDKFKVSDFGKELYQLFLILEFYKKWSGKEDTAESKAAIAAFSWVTSFIMKGLVGDSNVLESVTPLASDGDPASTLETVQSFSAEPFDKNALKVDETHGSIPSLETVFDLFDKTFISYLRLPKDTAEYIQARDKVIIAVYDLVKKHYPKITLHASSTITGFIGSCLGLFDTEDRHTDSDRKQPYRKYLRDSVYNILRANSLI